MKNLDLKDFDHMCYCPFCGDVRWNSYSANPGAHLPANWQGSTIDFVTDDRMPVKDRISAFYRSKNWVSHEHIKNIENLLIEKLIEKDICVIYDRRWIMAKSIMVFGAESILCFILLELSKISLSFVDQFNIELHILDLQEKELCN